MFLSQTRWCLFFAIFSCFLGMHGCTSTGKPEANTRIGMHVDAVLEFVVEYPLSWSKDRLITYGSKEGEIRWTSPAYPEALLQIKSFEKKQPGLNPKRQIDQALHAYVGLETISREKVTLPAGEAWYIKGQATHTKTEIYLFLRTGRNYLIALTQPTAEPNCCSDVMDKVTSSFRTMPQR